MTATDPGPREPDANVAQHSQQDRSLLINSLLINSLLIKVTVGSDAPERCAQGFTVAATAAASGVPVWLWLTGEAAWFALPGRAAEFTLPHAAPLAELLEVVLATGRVTLCTQCAQRRGIEAADLLPGISMGGAAAFVEGAITPGTQALVY